MTRNIVVAVAALAFALPVSTAWAKHHPKHHDHMATTAAQAEQIPGVNAMSNAPAEPAAQDKKAYAPMPGVNPM